MASEQPRRDAAVPGPNTAPAEHPTSQPAAADDDGKLRNDVPAVRFSSAVEEISPTATATVPQLEQDNSITEATADQLRAFATKSLQGKPLQERRMNTFQFEAFSLPPSRVPSRDDESPDSTRLSTPISSQIQSPHGSPRISALASPPLTPAGSGPSGAGERRPGKEAGDRTSGLSEPPSITPQPTSSHEKPSAAIRGSLAHRPASSDQVMRRSSSAEDHKSHRRGMFGGGGSSVPTSRESSPSRREASNFYSKPVTPGGDANDPYAKGRRPPQHSHPTRHSIDPRFVFSRKKKHGSPGGSKSSLSEKQGSGFFSTKNGSEEFSDSGHAPGHGGSMVDLKRFFRKSGHHKHHQKKRDASPAPSIKTGTKTPPSSRSTTQLPFGEDHGLTSKYGKLGKVLGSGAGGSVRLMRRKDDGTVFAVKEFRARHTYETEKEYNKKVTAEFCVGSTLHHGNIIETLDILQEKGRWFEVMEYAPFDLFAIVMTGKMSREEIRCCFLQILNGVTYLHSVGLAHRDLKLDNVVVSDKGIMKIIDFGSAHVFRYPFENGEVPAKGIVGSDPYLAPEVYDTKEYDAAAVDIWSLAIIFCCMTLRRFPWKIPRMTDNSFKLFAADPTPGHDPNRLLRPSKSESQLASTPARDFLMEDEVKEKEHHSHKRDNSETTSHHGDHHHKDKDGATGERKEVIRGPWRILRLLPRDSRHIVHRMLDLNPATRAKMDEILQEPWVADTVICQQLEHGEVIPAEDHTHVLEPPASQPQPKT
ncbi:HAL protein kinase [Purpureocillium lilacinum]|uniref:non-specific serine/threonine protein kinase n=1 Tax=Purpureocillium lilacinum TaxID=33203 RepID=A0A179HKD5_PURLI|nr:HAL protein kinase [Purpureocillium lilacinum]OAQ89930.1 HAL protein kinase [Purpureocillium lilacinum]